jgi:Xaa-Pro aminopeptidase
MMDRREFVRRRRQLLRLLGKGAIAILPAAPVRLRNRDSEYPYRQDSDFYYVTGFPEPDAVAVLAPGRPAGEYLLFCRDRDPAREVWDGARAGPEGAERDYGADAAFPIADIDDILPGLLEQRERVHYTMGLYPDLDQRMIGWVQGVRARGRTGTQTQHELIALEYLLHDMRLYKSRAELAVMRKSARIAVGAHLRAMRHCRPGLMEFELEAELIHEFCRHGAVPSYNPIVGGGSNACILHYRDNDARLREGDLVLIDAGCEHDYYASDVTRTFPVGGRFSREQRALYDVVLAAQRAAIDRVRAGLDWNAPHSAAVEHITRGLVRLGLLKGRVAKLVKDEAYRKFFMHRTGHWLGMDVHDVGDYKVGGQWRVLEPGMVLTVEPGIYIPPGTRGVARRWWGIGIRIEDDVLVTRGEPEVLTKGVPTAPEQIEALMRPA